METLELHYGRGKLIRLAAMGAAMTAASLWVALGGIDVAGTRGRRSGLGRMLGQEGVEMLGWAMAIAAGLFAILYVWRAFGDLVAARADAAGVTIHTVFGDHVYAAQDIAAIGIAHPAGQGILQVVPVKGRGKQRGLALNGLAEDEDEIGAWIDRVHTLHAGG
jgi:hypothetical protein